MPKLSLCIIAKPTYEEEKLLDRCLQHVASVCDEICVTQAGERSNKKMSKTIKDYGGKESFYKWDNDFAAARNFNFSQATGDYILWLDCDDILKGIQYIKKTIEKMEELKADIGVMNYLYDFDEYKRCTVKHLKTRIVKNDGCAKWEGKIHEDFMEQRALNGYMIEDIEILHLPKGKHAVESGKRNLAIALQTLKTAPEDPRSYWLVANAQWGENNNTEAAKNFLKFVDLSGSEEEKYLAYLNLASIEKKSDYALQALKIRPTYPNAYFKLAELLYEENKKDQAIGFTEIGLQLPKPESSIIVYNPMDYDYNPLMLLMRIHFDKGDFQKSFTILEELHKVYPDDKNVANKLKIIQKELGEALDADKYLTEAESIKDKNELKKFFDKLPAKLKSHPKLVYHRNINFIKEESSGKDLVYYCGYTTKTWNPEIAETEGVGGSEEAVINLAKRWAKMGWNVQVYNNCGSKRSVFDGVEYIPYWEYNVRDKQDVTILWRHPKNVDYDINSGKVFVDMHDVLPAAEFTKERIVKIDKVFVKTNAHRILFPNIPDEKIVIIPNGLDVSMFENQNVERNPYLILNTSSPDRHLEATLDIFEKIITQSDKPWKLAWYYGWGVYDSVHENNHELLAYKKNCMERFNKLVEQGRAEGGTMIGHKDIARKYLEAGVFLYPTQFYEIHCISAAKAQAAGCACVTSDFAALDETIMFGNKLHTDGERWKRDNTFGDLGKEDRYIKAIKYTKPHPSQQDKAKQRFGWDLIATKWENELKSTLLS